MERSLYRLSELLYEDIMRLVHLLISVLSQTVSFVSDMKALLSGFVISGSQLGMSDGVPRWKVMVG